MTTVSARFVVAADGTHSTVRHTLGIPMRGPAPRLESLTALFTAPLWDRTSPRAGPATRPTH